METMLAQPLTVVVVIVLVSAGTDLWKFRIYNALTVPLFLSGLIYHSFAGQVAGLTCSVMGLLAGTLPFLPLYLKGGMGAGDIKLMAGVGAWLGPWFTLHVIIVSGLTTGGISAALWIWNRVRLPQPAAPGPTSDRGIAADSDSRNKNDNVTTALCRGDRRFNAVPFAPMVAVGVIITALWIG